MRTERRKSGSLRSGIEEECSIVIAPSEVTREEMDTPEKILNLVKSKC